MFYSKCHSDDLFQSISMKNLFMIQLLQVHITIRNVFAIASYCLILEIMCFLTSGLTMSGCVRTNRVQNMTKLIK